MSIDTEIRHVTKPGANIFLDLGFEAEEANQLHADAQRIIAEKTAIKEALMGELTSWMAENHLKQLDAAEILKVTRPRVSDVVNKKANKFTIDALVDMLGRAGKHVQLAVC